jgi:cytochrome P450
VSFKDDNSTIIDMVFEFFIAATQTSASLSLNVFHHLIQSNQSLQKLKDEFKKHIYPESHQEGQPVKLSEITDDEQL